MYKLIAFLNTLNKILKLIISKYLYSIVKIYDMLSSIRIRVRKYKLTNIVLQFIIKKIHTI